MRDRLPIPVPASPVTRRTLARVEDGKYALAIIQSHLFVSNVLAARRIQLGTPILWISHTSDHIPAGSWLSDRLVARYEHVLAGVLRRHATHVTGVSREASRWLGHFGIRSDTSIGNAVDIDALGTASKPPQPTRIVFVGRLLPRKGALEAIDVVESASAALARWGLEAPRLTIVGGGPLLDAVKERAQAARFQVEVTGPLEHSQVRDVLSKAHVFLYPSHYPEGFPTVLLEAGALGCAVVTSAVPGAQELLDDGHGFIASSSEEAVATLVNLCRHPLEARMAGERLRSRVAELYTWPAAVDRILLMAGVSDGGRN